MSATREPFEHDSIERACDALRSAKALIVSAGAGMGVDSGLPDFRGDEGFWRAYPPFRRLGLSFSDLANPRWFSRDPSLAWGFYGHRLMLYRTTAPHAGFSVLRALATRVGDDAHFVFTSNVDGQFQRAGFDDARVCECHGSIHWLQCTRNCGVGLFDAGALSVDVDPETFRARGALPTCPGCKALARPAILMFGDGGWDSSRTDAQETRLSRWLDAQRERAQGALVVVECGAGSAIPTVRRFSEATARNFDGTLLRINVREPETPREVRAVSFAHGARATLEALDARLRLDAR